jgi:hypothetical protein
MYEEINEKFKNLNLEYYLNILVWFVVINAIFKNILVISWRSVLLVEETGISKENH